MTPLLFEKDATVFTSRGLYALSDAIECTVTEERNGGFELELVYPITGAHFSEITEDRIIVAVPYEGGNPQAFRIYRREADLEGEITFFARHISYQLNFIPVDLVSGSTDSAQVMMETIAAEALTAQPFTMYSDITTIVPLDFSVGMPCGLRSALGGQEGSVLDRFGGEFLWDNWTVNLLDSRGQDNGVRIAYGSNMTELNDTIDIGETVTGVMCFWQGDDGNGNIVTVYSSPKVMTIASSYAHERIVALDISDQFESEPTQLDVTSYADAWLRRTSSVDPTTEIVVSFVPLGQTPEYSWESDVDVVHLCDTINVRYPALGLSVKKQVTRCVWNVLLDRYDEITLGEEPTLADTILDLESGMAQGGGSGGSGGGGGDLLAAYPIGSFYISLVSIDPGILFGGTWDQITGRFLIATGANEDNTTNYWGNLSANSFNCPAGELGGEAWHTLSVNELASHQHPADEGNANVGYLRSAAGVSRRTVASGSGATNHYYGSEAFSRTTGTYTGGNAGHNNMPPYLAVYMWTRIA